MEKTNYELVSWNSTFSVGIKIIDDQHKGLLDLVNDMFNHVTGDPVAEQIYFTKVIKQAIQYIKIHFYTEEKIMIHYNFPGYSEHKREHDNFVINVVESIKKFDSSKKLALLEFTKFLKDWVLSHVAIMDKQYFTYFLKIARKNANGKLVLQQEKFIAAS